MVFRILPPPNSSKSLVQRHSASSGLVKALHLQELQILRLATGGKRPLVLSRALSGSQATGSTRGRRWAKFTVICTIEVRTDSIAIKGHRPIRARVSLIHVRRAVLATNSERKAID